MRRWWQAKQTVAIGADAPVDDGRRDARKTLLAGYIATYNSLDALCWAIPTRVYAGSFVVLALLAKWEPVRRLDYVCGIAALFVLAAVSLSSASSLRRIWLDHSRMGFWIAALETELAPDIPATGGFIEAAETAPRAVGYFAERHLEKAANFSIWQREVFDRSRLRDVPRHYWQAWTAGPFSLTPQFGARHINVLIMRVTGVVFLVAALTGSGFVVADFCARHDPTTIAWLLRPIVTAPLPPS